MYFNLSIFVRFLLSFFSSYFFNISFIHPSFSRFVLFFFFFLQIYYIYCTIILNIVGVHWTFLSYSNSLSKIVLILHSLLLPSLSFPNIIRFHYFSSHLLSYPYILHYLPQISFYLLNAALRSTKIINILRFSPFIFSLQNSNHILR